MQALKNQTFKFEDNSKHLSLTSRMQFSLELKRV
jgi:hypothetical protein